MSDTSRSLYQRLIQGDEHAGEDIVQRYAALLYTIIVERLFGKAARKIDPDEVLQSVWGAFFGRHAGTAHPSDVYAIERPGDLRALLCAFARNKTANKIRDVSRQKRDVSREVPLDASLAQAASDGRPLSHEQVVELADEVEAILGRLDDRERAVALLLLQDKPISTIAGHLGCGERQVRRILESARGRLRAAFVPEA